MRQRLTAISVLTGVLACVFVVATASSRARRDGQDDPNSITAAFKVAKKPAVGQPLIIEGRNVCGPKGKTSNRRMQELNNNKNRTDEPAANDYIPVEWEVMKGLPADAVDEIQGAPVMVVGYLSHRVNVEDKGSG